MIDAIAGFDRQTVRIFFGETLMLLAEHASLTSFVFAETPACDFAVRGARRFFRKFQVQVEEPGRGSAIGNLPVNPATACKQCLAGLAQLSAFQQQSITLFGDEHRRRRQMRILWNIICHAQRSTTIDAGTAIRYIEISC